MGQERFDGLEIEVNKARFSGTFDLDASDAQQIGLDRVAFFVVAVKIGGANIRTTKDADIQRVDLLQVEDARLATGEIRDEVVKWLAGHHDQQELFNERLGLAPADGPEFDEPVREVEVVAGPYVSEGNGSSVPEMPLDGPKVAKFDPDAVNDPDVKEVELVDSLYGDRKDKALARFMESGL